MILLISLILKLQTIQINSLPYFADNLIFGIILFFLLSVRRYYMPDNYSKSNAEIKKGGTMA